MKKDNNFLEIGKVLKPNGIRGELKVLPLTDLPQDLTAVKEVKLDGKMFTVDSLRITGDFCYIHLAGINDRNLAETLRDKTLEADRSMLPSLAEGSYYISDMIGLKVMTEGQVLGELTDILQYGSADIYEVKGSKPFMFPLVGDIIKNVDAEAGIIELNKSELDKVAVYED